MALKLRRQLSQKSGNPIVDLCAVLQNYTNNVNFPLKVFTVDPKVNLDPNIR
jgi:hypothetical protein